MTHEAIRRSESAVSRHLEYVRQRGLSHGTIYARSLLLARLAAALPVPLLDADAGMLAEWRAGLRVSRNTCGDYACHTRRFYAWAAEENLIAEDPAARLAVPRSGRTIPRPIGDDDLFAALETAPPRVRPWLVLAAWAGLRAKEIALLRRECVLDTLARPALLIATDATKGRNERIVPLSPFVVGELRAAGLPASGWVFRRQDGHYGPNTPAKLSHLANRHLHGCGINATLHQLRHRFGTEAYRSGHDLRAVQELMGHASPETTAGYAAYANESAIAAVNALPTPRGTAGHLRTVGGL